MDINLKDFPDYSTVTVERAGRTMNFNVQSYMAKPGDVVVTVLRPETRAAVAAAQQ